MAKRVNKDQLTLATPQFITWKKYGFRHIVETETTRDGRDHHFYGQVTVREGKAICGNDYWMTEYAKPPSYAKPWDIRSTRRPLCGACRKKWKKLYGQELH